MVLLTLLVDLLALLVGIFCAIGTLFFIFGFFYMDRSDRRSMLSCIGYCCRWGLLPWCWLIARLCF
jgi:hypothetical protein